MAENENTAEVEEAQNPPGIIDVTAKKNDNEQTVKYNFGADLQGAVALFGEEVVYNLFVAQGKIQLQAVMRTRMEKGADVADLVNIWKPGVKLSAPAVDPMVAAAAKFQSLSDEEKAAFIAKLKGE